MCVWLSLADLIKKTTSLLKQRFQQEAYCFSPRLIWVPPNSGRRTVSPSFTLGGTECPSLVRPPGPTDMTTPELTCNTKSGRISCETLHTDLNPVTGPRVWDLSSQTPAPFPCISLNSHQETSYFGDILQNPTSQNTPKTQENRP
jgi:hypothetical protein